MLSDVSQRMSPLPGRVRFRLFLPDRGSLRGLSCDFVAGDGVRSVFIL